MDEIDRKDLARMLSLLRVAVGVGAFLAPKRFARAWTGDDADGPSVTMSMRGLGARDVALGLGTLVALEHDGNARGWLEAQALSDASDTVSTLASFGRLPGLRRWLSLASAGTACYLGITLAQELD